MRGFISFFKVYSIVILTGLSLTIYFPGNHLASDQSSSGSGSSSAGSGGGFGGGGGAGGGGGGSYGGSVSGTFGGGYANADGSGVTASGISYSSTTTATASRGGGFNSGMSTYSGSSLSGASFGGSASYGGGVGGTYGGYNPDLSNADWAAQDQADTNSLLEYDPETGAYNLPDVFGDQPNDSQPNNNQPTEMAGPPAPQPEMPQLDQPQFDAPQVDNNVDIAAPSMPFSPNATAPDLGNMNVQPANNTAIGDFGSFAGAIDFTSPVQTSYSAPSFDYNQVYNPENNTLAIDAAAAGLGAASNATANALPDEVRRYGYHGNPFGPGDDEFTELLDQVRTPGDLGSSRSGGHLTDEFLAEGRSLVANDPRSTPERIAQMDRDIQGVRDRVEFERTRIGYFDYIGDAQTYSGLTGRIYEIDVTNSQTVGADQRPSGGRLITEADNHARERFATGNHNVTRVYDPNLALTNPETDGLVYESLDRRQAEIDTAARNAARTAVRRATVPLAVLDSLFLGDILVDEFGDSIHNRLNETSDRIANNPAQSAGEAILQGQQLTNEGLASGAATIIDIITNNPVTEGPIETAQEVIGDVVNTVVDAVATPIESALENTFPDFGITEGISNALDSFRDMATENVRNAQTPETRAARDAAAAQQAAQAAAQQAAQAAAQQAAQAAAQAAAQQAAAQQAAQQAAQFEFDISQIDLGEINFGHIGF